MSALSVVLSEFFQGIPESQTAYAAAHGLDRSILNRTVKGADVPGPDTARQIISTLPKEKWQGRATAAWVQDRTPEELRALVITLPHDSRGEEVPAIKQLPDDLPPDLREALLWFAQMAVTHPEIRTLLFSLRRSLSARVERPQER